MTASAENLVSELRLVRTDRAIRPACAYLLSGHDARGWLAEMTRWSVPLVDANVYVLPRSRSDIRPAGALVVLPAGVSPAVSQRPLPYGRFGRNLLLPVDAKLTPAVAPEELAALVPHHCCVFHPTIGLVGFEEADALRVYQLLSAPPTSVEGWDSAQAGTAGIELQSIGALPAPSVRDIIEQGRREIGTESIASLGPSEDERFSSPAGRAVGKVVHGGLKIIGGAAKAVRAMFGARGGRLDKFIRRVGQAMEDIRRALQEQRYRQIARLLRLLERSLDAGIRFALPLDGKLARGTVSPGARLHRRNTNFNLQRLGGGEPADSWAVPDDVRQRLKELYRQAADREIALGRFRRAAYIYAHLLADYHSAANVLVQGRHFREAAVLYKEYLHNPGQAAKCLESGGLLAEAIEIYWEMQEFEKAGDLYATMGNADAAAAAYQRAVDKCLKSKDHLRAAWLLENRLHCPDEAVETLWSAWPQSTQAPTCLKEHFMLLGRLGRHVDAQRRAVELMTSPRNQASPLAEVLAGLSGQYPYAPVCNQMADVARVVAGRAMPLASREDVAKLSGAVASLVPSDRLLQRDADRYLRSRQIAPRPAPLEKISRISWIPLPEGLWSSFASTPECLFAAGASEDSPKGMLRFMVHDWKDVQGSVRWDQLATLAERPLLAPMPAVHRSVIAIGRRDMRLDVRTVPVAGSARSLRVGTPTWLPTPLLAVACDDEGAVLAVTAREEEFVVSKHTPKGRLLWTRSVKRCNNHQDLSCIILPQPGGFFMAVDCCFFSSTGPNDKGCHRMDEIILSIAACPDGSGGLQAVSTRSGGWMVGKDQGEDYQRPLEDADGELRAPDFPGELHILFLRKDLLVAVSKSGGGVYRVEAGVAAVRLYDLPGHPAMPLAVLPGPHPWTFAIASDHRVDLYGVPRIGGPTGKEAVL